jgi:hypothetical protein
MLQQARSGGLAPHVNSPELHEEKGLPVSRVVIASTAAGAPRPPKARLKQEPRPGESQVRGQIDQLGPDGRVRSSWLDMGLHITFDDLDSVGKVRSGRRRSVTGKTDPFKRA